MSILAKKRTDLNLNDPAIVAEFDKLTDTVEDENSTMTDAETSAMFSDVSVGQLDAVEPAEEVKPVTVDTIETVEMCSGFGGYHTNGPLMPDGTKRPDKDRKPYVGITLEGIRALADNPQTVDKAQAQWLIPSSYKGENGRTHNYQGKNGQFWFLWADLDDNPPTIDSVNGLVSLYLNCDYEVYASRSATEERQKSHINIPLDKPLTGKEWVTAQICLNDWLEEQKIIPDRTSERPGQITYLPNKGSFYTNASRRDGKYFNPLVHFKKQIADLELAKEEYCKDVEVRKAAAKIKKEARKSVGFDSPVDAFNNQRLIENVLNHYGYIQKPRQPWLFMHPASETGSYSASVKNNRVHSMSSADPLCTMKAESGSGGAHDAFSAFTILGHNGDRDAAIKDAGDEWLAIGNESWNKVKQREFKQNDPKMSKTAKSFDVDTEEVIGNIDVLDDPFDVSSINLARPHGVAGVICQEIHDMAKRPLPMSYPLVAMHILNTMKGKRLGLGDLKTNFISLVIAETATGKDINNQAMDMTTTHFSESRGIRPFVSRPRSDKDLITNILFEGGQTSYEVDEAHELFNAIGSPNAPAYLRNIATELLKMATTKKYKLAPLHRNELQPKVEDEIKKLKLGIEKEEEQYGADKAKAIAYAEAKGKADVPDKDNYFLKVGSSALAGYTDSTKLDAMKCKLISLEEKLDMIVNGIKNPTVNLMMFSTPEEMDSIGNTKSIQSGLMGRALVRRIDEEPERLVLNPKRKHFSYELLTRLGRIENEGECIGIKPEAEQLIHDILEHYEQVKYRAHPKKGGLYRRMLERITTVASMLAVEDGIIGVEDVRYALATTLDHIEVVTFLANKNSADESTEDLVTHIMDLISQKVKGVGIAQSKIKQDVLACSKTAKENDKLAKIKNTPSLYDKALTIMIDSGAVMFEGNTSKLKRP